MSSQLKPSQTSKHTQPAAPSPIEASTPSDRYVGTLTFNRPLKLEYLEVGGKHGLFEGNLLVAVVGECCPDHAESFAREIQKRVNEREELIGALRNLVEFMDKSGMSTTTVGGKDPFKYGGFEYSVVSEARAVLAKVDGE